MTIYNDSFFQNEVSIKRRDGHLANDLIPVGTHIYIDLTDTLEKVITPPPEAVAFYGNLIVGSGVRYTLDGVTAPTATVGFNSIQPSGITYIKPGTAIRVRQPAAGTAAINVQWLGSV